MNNKNLHSIALTSTVLILFLTLISFSASAVPFAYIPNSGSGTVSVIDTETNTVIATTNLGGVASGITVLPSATKAYVGSWQNTVSVIDTDSNTVITTVNLGRSPAGLSISPDGRKVFVANGYAISVIDTATNAVTDIMQDLKAPRGVAATGSKLYVTEYLAARVSVINIGTNAILGMVSVGNQPYGVAVTPDRRKVYVANFGSDNVSVIDTATNNVIATIPVGKGPQGVAIAPDGTKAYVTNSNYGNTGTVSVIDTATNTVTSTVNVGNQPYGVAVTPDGKNVYVVNFGSNDVSVVDTATNNVIATVPVGKWPTAFGQFICTPIIQPVIPIANFSSNVTYGYAPLSVQFTDLSTKATRWSWEFGDGNNSNDQNPTYTYLTEGVYSVFLTASNTYGQSGKTATINVLPAPLKTPTITWNTPADITAGTALGSEQLNAIATDPNTGNSVTGTFTYNSEEGTVLNVGAHTLHADFTPSDSATYNNTSADVQINVLPVPLKTPIITWDNPADIIARTALSNTQLNAVAKDPVTGATIAGTFTYKPAADTVLGAGMGQALHVDFVPTDTAIYNTASKDVTINVLDKPVAPVANFSASPLTGKAPLIVSFTDSSTGSPKSWRWDFGDKSISTDQNPVHTYDKAGKYTVSLKVENAVGKNKKIMSKYITVDKNSKKK